MLKVGCSNHERHMMDYLNYIEIFTFERTWFSTTPDNYRPANNLKYEYFATLKTFKIHRQHSKGEHEVGHDIVIETYISTKSEFIDGRIPQIFWDPGLTSPYWTAVNAMFGAIQGRQVILKTAWMDFTWSSPRENDPYKIKHRLSNNTALCNTFQSHDHLADSSCQNQFQGFGLIIE